MKGVERSSTVSHVIKIIRTYLDAILRVVNVRAVVVVLLRDWQRRVPEFCGLKN